MTEPRIKKAVFAGGCFWCMEGPFEAEEGVVEAVAGYCGGGEENPSYEEVCRGETGHRESVQVTYDANIVDYEYLLDVFWRQIDPTDASGQFADRGYHYQSAIFYSDEHELKAAALSKRQLDESGVFDRPVVTEILPMVQFYPAEDYHQNYYQTNESHYNAYKAGSGRKAFIEDKWKGRSCPVPRKK